MYSLLFVTLDAGENMVCVNQTIIQDKLVEGNERVSLVFSTYTTGITLHGAGGEGSEPQIDIFILDNTGITMNFL